MRRGADITSLSVYELVRLVPGREGGAVPTVDILSLGASESKKWNIKGKMVALQCTHADADAVVEE